MSFLSPIDLLSVSASEQTILRCLTKNPRCTVHQIAAATQLPLVEVENLLETLLSQNRVIELLTAGERVFATRFQFKRQAVRNMPLEILEAFEQPSDQFLAELPLTADLPPESANELLALGEKRTLLPDEVLAWQGEKPGFLGVVQRGLLTRQRLQGQRSRQKAGYLNRKDWIGLSEAFAGGAFTATYTAATETTLLLWQVPDFLDFVQHHNGLAQGLAHYFNSQLRQCEQAHTQGKSKLWVAEGAHSGAGVTTFALNLALLSQQQSEQAAGGRTLFWGAATQPEELTRFVGAADGPARQVGLAHIQRYSSGIDVLLRLDRNSYAPRVQLDMLLTDLMNRYETVICDSGSVRDSELLLRLRGQAHTLLTLTSRADEAAAGMGRWAELQAYSYPGQKRVLALNKAAGGVTDVDARFHLVIPQDETGLAAAVAERSSLTAVVPESPLAQTLTEVYRRLSLNHAVALFVPSTLDVDQHVDNSEQVQSALSFLGNLFGGATSSNAEGAWRSEESGLVTEQVTIVRTFVSKKALDKHLDDVLTFATDLKSNMKQEAVAISVDNQLILV